MVLPLRAVATTQETFISGIGRGLSDLRRSGEGRVDRITGSTGSGGSS
jgi:hypothetical protein